MTCPSWKLSGRCDNFDCDLKHPEICKEYNECGICSNRYNCRAFHPVMCRKMICFGENCEFFHPKKNKKRNVCKNWKTNGTCSYKNKCKFFHPIICEQVDCKAQDCNLFHIGGYNITPMRTKIISFAQNLDSDIIMYEDTIKPFMKYPDYYQIMLTQIVKYHRHKILEQLFETDFNYQRLNRIIGYNVFTSLVWPKLNNFELENIKQIFTFLVDKKFKIFNENVKFENETFLDSLLHKENPYDKKTQMILYDYFTKEWNNPHYCHDLLNTFINLLNHSNIDKYSYIINFLAFKNVDLFLNILYNKVSYIFSDEVKIIIDCLLINRDHKSLKLFYEKENVKNLELKFIDHITNNVEIFLEKYFESEKFLNMIYENNVEKEKVTVYSHFFELLGYMYQLNESSISRKTILNSILVKFNNINWSDNCIVWFGKFCSVSKICVNKTTYDVFKNILKNIIGIRSRSKSNQLKLDNILSVNWKPVKKKINEEDYQYLECIL